MDVVLSREGEGMSKVRKVTQAILNRAMMNPDDFLIEPVTGAGVNITYKPTGDHIHVWPSEGIIIMGTQIELWASGKRLPQYDIHDPEYMELWQEFKYKRKAF